MQNQLMKFEDMQAMSNIFYESKMFKDVTGSAAALVKIQAGQEMGVAPFAAMSGIYIIQGRATVGAHIIAGRIKASEKYDFRVLELTDLNCRIEFLERGQSIGISTFSIDDAKKAGTQNIGKHPRNMLYARAVSNGQKWFCPDVFDSPVYVEGEITEDAAPGSVTIVEPLPVMDVDHPKFLSALDWLQNKGGTIAELKESYTLTESALDSINNSLTPQAF